MFSDFVDLENSYVQNISSIHVLLLSVFWQISLAIVSQCLGEHKRNKRECLFLNRQHNALRRRKYRKSITMSSSRNKKKHI